MKKRAVLILAAVLCIIAGLAVFFSKNHVKNTDVLLNNNIDIKISAEDNGQNDSQNYWNADNHNFAKGDGGSVGYGKCFGGNLLFCAGKRFI